MPFLAVVIGALLLVRYVMARRRRSLEARGATATPAARRRPDRAAIFSLAAAGVALSGAFLAVLCLPEPKPADPEVQAERLLSDGEPGRAERVLVPWLRQRLDDVMAHRRFLWVHFQIPRATGRPGARNDRGIESFYQDLRDSSDGRLRDVATYGLGLCSYYRGDFRRALVRYSEPSEGSRSRC